MAYETGGRIRLSASLLWDFSPATITRRERDVGRTICSEPGEVPAAVRTLVLEKAEGNPLFVEEVIRSFVDSGGDCRQRRSFALGWRYNRLTMSRFRTRFKRFLVSRIDRLESDTRQVLQLASVIGRSFRHNVLDNTIEPPAPLAPHLATLQRVELVRESARQPDLRYTFKHELTRDAAYATILRRRRPQFHRRVGEVTESLYRDRLEEEADRLLPITSLRPATTNAR